MHTAVAPRRGLNLDVLVMVFEYLDLDTIRKLDTMPVSANVLPSLQPPLSPQLCH